jgi:ergothioneine biosynthesis protein EgtB
MMVTSPAETQFILSQSTWSAEWDNDQGMIDRATVIDWYKRNRARSRAIFDLLEPDVYYDRPIALRHPIVFYEGHLPAFSFNTLVKKALGGRSIDERLEAVFARGIDPHEAASRGGPSRQSGPGRGAGEPSAGPEGSVAGPKGPALQQAAWPTRDEVRAFADEADRRVLEALSNEDLERPGDPLLDGAEAAFTILEHEAMHHETLLYMWHRLPLEKKRRPAGYAPHAGTGAPSQEWIEVPGGCATLGVGRGDISFGWDNEFPRTSARVDDFLIDRFNVTNGDFLEFVEAGGYDDPRWWREDDWAWVLSEGIAQPLFWEERESAEGAKKERGRGDWQWRGMFDPVPLPLAWPVYVSHAEASAYARWRSGRSAMPMRLPTEAEYQRAAFGAAATAADVPHRSDSLEIERPFPWGADGPSPDRGVFDFTSWDPEPVDGHPNGRSAWGVNDLVGNGWEWTSTVFAPFPGFRPMASYPEYSADFFDGEHMVMKGASPVTAKELLRPTFRNWFRRRYPYVYASFRCVASRSAR